MKKDSENALLVVFLIAGFTCMLLSFWLIYVNQRTFALELFIAGFIICIISIVLKRIHYSKNKKIEKEDELEDV